MSRATANEPVIAVSRQRRYLRRMIVPTVVLVNDGSTVGDKGGS